MGSLFSKPKPIKAPPVPAPPPIPEISDETGDEARRRAVARSGRRKTVITGSLVPTSTGKKTTLG